MTTTMVTAKAGFQVQLSSAVSPRGLAFRPAHPVKFASSRSHARLSRFVVHADSEVEEVTEAPPSKKGGVRNRPGKWSKQGELAPKVDSDANKEELKQQASEAAIARAAVKKEARQGRKDAGTVALAEQRRERAERVKAKSLSPIVGYRFGGVPITLNSFSRGKEEELAQLPEDLKKVAAAKEEALAAEAVLNEVTEEVEVFRAAGDKAALTKSKKELKLVNRKFQTLLARYEKADKVVRPIMLIQKELDTFEKMLAAGGKLSMTSADYSTVPDFKMERPSGMVEYEYTMVDVVKAVLEESQSTFAQIRSYNYINGYNGTNAELGEEKDGHNEELQVIRADLKAVKKGLKASKQYSITMKKAASKKKPSPSPDAEEEAEN